MHTLFRFVPVTLVSFFVLLGTAYAVPEQCSPYYCADGTLIDRCDENGNDIQYFAEPCHMNGGLEGAVFSDVSFDHPNAAAIVYVREQGIVEGYPDGTYRPDATINRAEFIKIMDNSYLGDLQFEVEHPWGICNAGEASTAAIEAMMSAVPFSDISESDWFTFYVCVGAKAGLIQGYPDGTFKPANPINFAEAAKIIVKAFGLESTTTIPSCDDADPFECAWYRPYVLILDAYRAIPISIHRFGQNITRGEMAEMIYRLQTKNSDKDSQPYDSLQFMAYCDRLIAAGHTTCE